MTIRKMRHKAYRAVEIRGSGGGKSGGGRVAQQAEQIRSSRQYAHVTEVICEGPSVGPASVYHGENVFKSVYYDETVVMNPDKSMNFSNVDFQYRVGAPGQTAMTGVSDTRVSQVVGIRVRKDTSVTRTITNAEATGAVVTVGFPRLTSQNKQNGDINRTSVRFAIDLQTAGGGFVQKFDRTLNDAIYSRYQQDYFIPLTGQGPWDIRVRRLTDDSEDEALQNETWFDILTTVVDEAFVYPNTAVVHTVIDSQNFGTNIPARAYDWMGLIVDIPSNYDPINRVYNGTWDGTYIKGWTDNPVWCYREMLINARFGLGEFFSAEQVDAERWALYTIAQYCDQLVPDGRGGMEPRFTCNLLLQKTEEAYNVIQNMASIFRAIVYWGGGSLVTSQDRPGNVVASFNNSNVIDGKFVYQGADASKMHNVAYVTWCDPDDFYRQVPEYVQLDDAEIAKYGVIQLDIGAIGCTSRGQAHRLGKWALLSERLSEAITFSVGLDSNLTVYPGAIIEVTDRYRAGKSMGGRIKSSTLTEITLDREVELPAGETHTVAVYNHSGERVVRGISNTGKTTVLTLTQPLEEPGIEFSSWTISSLNLKPEQWRIVTTTESPDKRGVISINAIRYAPEKFDAAEQNIRFDLPPTSTIKSRPDAPTNLRFDTTTYSVDGTVTAVRGVLSWESPEPRFRVRYRNSTGNWVVVDNVLNPYLEIDAVNIDTYSFEVVAVSAVGIASPVAKFTHEVTPAPIELPNVAGLRFVGDFTSEKITVAWEPTEGAIGYLVQVLNGEDAVCRQSKVGNTLEYTYDAAQMRLDGGPWRHVTVRVKALGIYDAESTDWSSISADNPQIGLLQGIEVDGGIHSVYFRCIKPSEDDLAGILVWISDNASFEPTLNNVAYDGLNNLIVFNKENGTAIEGGKNYYVWAAGYDTFGKDELNISSSVSVMAFSNAPDMNTIIADMVKDGELDQTKFASNIRIPKVVSELPETANELDQVILAGNGKIYQYESGEWVPVVSATKFDGQLLADQLADNAITLEKLNDDIGVIQKVDALPASGELDEYVSYQGEIYRWDGSQWTKHVHAADIIGDIVQSQFSPDLSARINLLGVATDGTVDSRIQVARDALVQDIDLVQQQVDIVSNANVADLEALGTAQLNNLFVDEQNRVTAMNATNAEIADRIAQADQIISDLQDEIADRISGDAVIDQKVTNLKSEYDTNKAQVQSTLLTLASEDTALGQRIDNLTTTVSNNKASATQTTNALATADIALGERIDNLTATVNDNNATATQTTAALANADSALTQRLDNLTSTVSDNKAEFDSAVTTFTNKDQAQTTARQAMLAQFTGGYTGNDLGAITSGLLFQQSQVISNVNQSLSEQISLLSAGVGEQFDPLTIWNYDVDIEGWTVAVANQTKTTSGITITATGSNSYLQSPVISAAGGTYTQVKARIRRLSSSAVWDGRCLYRTAGHGFSGSYRKNASEPDFNAGWALVTWDMADLDAGGTDWGENTVTGIRLYFGKNSGDSFEIDWIAVGRPSPGASYAALADERQARADADSAQVTAHNQLKSRVDTAEAAITSNDQARVDGDQALTQSLNQHISAYNSNKASVSSTLQTLASADQTVTNSLNQHISAYNSNKATVQNSLTTLANADSAISDRVDTLSSTVGNHTTSIQTHASTIDGLKGQYTVKIDNNGYVTGYGLASESVDGVPTSTFKMVVDNFELVSASTPGLQPFTIVTDGGVARIAMNGDLIVKGTIYTDQLAINAVTNDKIANDAVNGDKIANDAIGTDHIIIGAVTARAIAALAVNASKIVNGAIVTEKLATNAVTANKVAADAITANKIAADAVTARAIQAEAVTTDKLAANSVVAGKIAAGAIGADQIQAKAITTDKMVITGSNLIPNSDFATSDFTNWRPYSTPAGTVNHITDGNSVNAAIKSSAPTAYFAHYACTAGVNRTIGVFTHAKSYKDAGAENDGIQVKAGERYYVSIDVARQGAGSGNFQVVAYFRKKDGSVVANGAPISKQHASITANAWTSLTGEAEAPADSQRMYLYVVWQNANGTTAAPVQLCWTNLRCIRMSSGELIVDGAITAQKLGVGSVTADKLLANSVTTEKLVANAITADKLAVDSVTANAIAANAITAQKIAAKAVTADKINVNALDALAATMGTVTIGQGKNGYLRTYNKGWNDNRNGLHIFGSTSANVFQFEVKGGANRIAISNNASTIDFGDNFHVDQNGHMTISQLNVIDTLNLAGGSVTTSASYSGSGVFYVSTPSGTIRLIVFASMNTPHSNGNANVAVNGVVRARPFSFGVTRDIDFGQVTDYYAPVAMWAGPVNSSGTLTVSANGVSCSIFVVVYKR